MGVLCSRLDKEERKDEEVKVACEFCGEMHKRNLLKYHMTSHPSRVHFTSFVFFMNLVDFSGRLSRE